MAREEPLLESDRAIELLRKQLGMAPESLPYDDPQVDRWWSTTENVIRNAFGSDHPNVSEFTRTVGEAQTPQGWQREHLANVRNRKALLEGYIDCVFRGMSISVPK